MKFLETRLPKDIDKLLSNGLFNAARDLINERLTKPIPKSLKERLKFELFRIEILKRSYPYTKTKALNIFKKSFKNATKEEFDELLKSGKIDFIYLEGKKVFQKRFSYNIGFSSNDYKKRMVKDPEREKITNLTNETTRKLINTRTSKEHKIRARITIKHENPLNKDVSVWLPIPLKKFQQSEVKILNSSHEGKIASNNALQRTIYMEGKDNQEFWVEFEYTISEFLHNEKRFLKPIPTDKDLLEKPPHIKFTPYLKEMLNNILKGYENKSNHEKANRIYDFITKNVYYSYVLPYAVYDNIPEYMLKVLRGDCGFYATTFITLCRMAGIPAKWQSGWFATPFGASPHDWALFYTEEYGWLPADLSFGGARRHEEELRNFYFGNLDEFRMFANLDFQANFTPKKKHYRNDPYDNQVGEMESKENYIIDTTSKIEILDFE